MSEAILTGYHFFPTEEELITILVHFLTYKALGKQFPPSPVAEKVLYGDNATPWKIFCEDDAWESTESENGKKDDVFVLTQLSFMSANKKSRIAGCGTWKSQAAATEVMNQKGEIIGLKTVLSYKINTTSEPKPDEAQWRMYEYALAGVSLEEMELKHINVDNFVICKITRDYTKCKSLQKDQILGKRRSEVAPETSQQNKKLRRLIELVYFETQECQLNEERVNNMFPTAADANDSHPSSEGEAIANYSCQPVVEPEASGPEAVDDYTKGMVNETGEFTFDMGGMEWFTSAVDLDLDIMGLTSDTEVIPNEFLAELLGNEDSPTLAAESTVNDLDYLVIPPAAKPEAGAEASTTANPDIISGVDPMGGMEWSTSVVGLDLDIISRLTSDTEVIPNEFLPDNWEE